MEEIRDLILDKAQERVERFGFKKTTMDELSRDCGISKKTLYEHFEDKEDLFWNLLRRESLKTLDALFVQLIDIADPVRKLETLIRNAVLHFNQDNFITRIIKDQELFFSTMSPHCQGYIDDEIIARLAEIIQEGMAQGKFRQVDAQLAAYAGLKLFESFSHSRTSALFDSRTEDYYVGVLLDFIRHALVNPEYITQ